MSGRSRRVWTVLATIAATVGLMAGLTSTAQADVAYYQLGNQKASRCMSLDNGGSTDNGTNIVIYDCNGAKEQSWYLTSSKYEGYYYFKNRKAGSDQCLSIAGGGSDKPGAAAILWTCNGEAEQRWRLLDAGNGWFWMENDKSDLVLTLDGASSANNTRVVQWDWLSTARAQRWGAFDPAAA